MGCGAKECKTRCITEGVEKRTTGFPYEPITVHASPYQPRKGRQQRRCEVKEVPPERLVVDDGDARELALDVASLGLQAECHTSAIKVRVWQEHGLTINQNQPELVPKPITRYIPTPAAAWIGALYQAL